MSNARFLYLVDTSFQHSSDCESYEGPLERVRDVARVMSTIPGTLVSVVLSNDEERRELARFEGGRERRPIN